MTKTFSVSNPSRLRGVHRNCPLCDRDNTDERPNRYSFPPWTVRKCRACVFVYIDMAPEYEHLAVVLDWDKTHAAEIQRKAKTRRISYKLSRRTSVRNRRFLRQRRVHQILFADTIRADARSISGAALEARSVTSSMTSRLTGSRSALNWPAKPTPYIGTTGGGECPKSSRLANFSH